VTGSERRGGTRNSRSRYH